MITKDMIERGYKSGIVKVIDSENDRTAVCQIGERTFYFMEYSTDPEMTAAELKDKYTDEEIVHFIHSGLETVRHTTDFVEQTDYFESVFIDAGILPEIECHKI